MTVRGFDELNVLRTVSLTREIVQRIDECNRKGYKKIAKYVDDWFLYDVLMEDEGERVKTEEVVDETLKAYNPVTGYVYASELDRKRARLVEEIQTAVFTLDRARYEKVLRKAANLFYTQSMQYAIDVADAVMREAMRANGITKVMWLTERDERVCAECAMRDGKTFPIAKVPPKPHYNCRCVTVPVA